MTISKKAFYIVSFLFCFVGYIMNIQTVLQGIGLSPMTMIFCFMGIFFWPMGVILGWFL